MRTRRYSLSYLTLELSPPQTIDLAAQAGFDFAGIRMMPALQGGRAFPLMTDRRMFEDTKAALSANDIELLDVEIARIDGQTTVETWLPMLETAGKLGVRTVIAAGDDSDEARMTDTFGRLCDAAADFGLSVSFEFTPWTTLRDAATATRIVEAAGCANGEVLVDTIHVARSGSTLDDLSAIRPERMSYVQICDAPAGTPGTVENLLFTAREERLLPGEGGVDITGMIRALPADLIVSVEIPSHRRIAEMGPEAWMRTAFDASRRAVERADADRPANLSARS